MLRLPDDDGAGDGTVSVSVEPGQRAMILGLIRNQSEVVDNFDLSVRGLPEDWWTIAPATAYLVPYGTGGTYEQEIQIHIHPPRSPAGAGASVAVRGRRRVARVRRRGRLRAGERRRSGRTSTSRPELRPERAIGRLKARYRLIVRNKANARTEVAIGAEDTDAECQFRFAEPKIALEPGNAMECPFTVFPPKQIWIGKPLGPPVPGHGRAGRASTLPRRREWRCSASGRGCRGGSRSSCRSAALAVLVDQADAQAGRRSRTSRASRACSRRSKLLTKAGFTVAPKPCRWSTRASPPAASPTRVPAAGTKAKKGAR